MTGSVTLVDCVPIALYSCSGHAGSGISSARPVNSSDTLLLSWKKSTLNPLITVGGIIRQGFRDPSTAWKSGGRWRMLTACSQCNGTGSMLGLFSPDDFNTWEFTSTPLDVGQLECPDAWPVVTTDGSATDLFSIKLSQSGHEVIYVGSWDEAAQTLRGVVPPRLPAVNWPAERSSQLLDAATYASKSFFDPQHQQQVWTSWVREMLTATDGGCLNVSVCGTHTLPRTLLHDKELRAHVTPPVPQVELLRLEKLYSLPEALALAPGVHHLLPASVSSMQLEIRATFALPLVPLVLGVSSRRSADLSQQTSSHIAVSMPMANTSNLTVATLTNEVNNAAGGVMPHPQNWSQSIRFPVKQSDRNLTLSVYVDHSIVEAYAQHGRGVATTRTYPTDDALGVSVFCANAPQGSGVHGATLLALDVWRMDEIWVDMV